jgi:hypothetical protein
VLLLSSSCVEERQLERRRTLLGWSPGGVETYAVALVTDPAEMERATTSTPPRATAAVAERLAGG